jgi:hypothetical protein
MTNIKNIEKQWKEYAEEFANTDYMDIEQHTGMAFNVPILLKRIEDLEYVLWSCKNHAENIEERGYGESMDALYIIEEVNDTIGEDF